MNPFEDDFSRMKPTFPRKLPPYIKNISSLKIISQISSGSFGKVFKAYNPDRNESYAIKRMQFKGKNDLSTIKQIQRQINLLYEVNSPYLIKLLDHYEEERQGTSYIYLITELVDGKNLYDAILKPKKPYDEKILAQIIRDICQGLQYLHRKKIIHRDIKLENILITEKGVVKIIDLGESNFYGEEINRRTMRGTKTYFSPEIVNHDQQDDKVDVWCLGVIIYEIYCLQSPFRGSTEKQIMQNIRRFRYPIPEKLKKNKELLDLLQKIFTWQVERLSIQQVKNHPWIKNNINKEVSIKFEQYFKEEQTNAYRSLLLSEIDKFKQKYSKIVLKNKEIQRGITQIENGGQPF